MSGSAWIRTIGPEQAEGWLAKLYAALTGGLLLLIADLLARTVMAPIVLPVGILTSFTGAPLFLYLLVKHRDVRS